MAKLNLGDRAPGFDLPAVDGKSYSLEDFSGSGVLVVVISCVHCPYVRAWEDRLIDLQRKYHDRGVSFVLINANDEVRYPQDSFAAMQAHAREKSYPFPFLRDESQEVARGYGAERTPEVFVFDRERRLVYHGAPDDNYEEPDQVRHAYLKEAIEAVLAGEAVAIAGTPPVGCSVKWR